MELETFTPFMENSIENFHFVFRITFFKKIISGYSLIIEILDIFKYIKLLKILSKYFWILEHLTILVSFSPLAESPFCTCTIVFPSTVT